MQTTRRRFLLGATAAGVATATLDPLEVVRRFWTGWRAPTIRQGLVDAVLLNEHESALSFLQKLDAGYRTFDSIDGVVVRSLISNQAIPIPEGGTERYITLRDNAFLMPGDLVELSGPDVNDVHLAGGVARVVQRATGERPILGAVTERMIYPGDPLGPLVRVQVGGLAKVGYGETGSASGKLYRLGESLADQPERRRVRVPRPSRNG